MTYLCGLKGASCKYNKIESVSSDMIVSTTIKGAPNYTTTINALVRFIDKEDNKLTISYDDGYLDILTINGLIANRLLLAFEDWDNTDDDGLELDHITTTTYKKIG